MTEHTHNLPIERVRSLATTQFVTLPEALDAGTAVTRLKEAADAETIDAACVVGEDGRFVGLVTLRQCLASPPDRPLADLVDRAPAIARPGDTAEAGARRATRAAADILPIVTDDHRVETVVTAQTAYRYLVRMLDEDAERFVGLTSEGDDDYLSYSILSDFRRRIPWIFGLAVAGLAAGYVVHRFEHALDALVILALYMPMLADTGGNVGTQAASLVTRAIAVGSIDLSSVGRVLWRESAVSILVAAVLFAFAFCKVLLISDPLHVPEGLTLAEIGFAIAIALSVQVVSATLLGGLLPLGALVVRQDPAVVAGPALTTIVDLTGLLIYFTITTTMLGVPFQPG